jgi:hypothetical protein
MRGLIISSSSAQSARKCSGLKCWSSHSSCKVSLSIGSVESGVRKSNSSGSSDWKKIALNYFIQSKTNDNTSSALNIPLFLFAKP